jgi:hypothetical protein
LKLFSESPTIHGSRLGENTYCLEISSLTIFAHLSRKLRSSGPNVLTFRDSRACNYTETGGNNKRRQTECQSRRLEIGIDIGLNALLKLYK